MTSSIKYRRKKLRQDVLREYLAERGKLSYIFDNIEKLELAKMTPHEMAGLKAGNEQRIKLLAKYLPDTKEVTIDAMIEAKVDTSMKITLVDATVIKKLDKRMALVGAPILESN